MRAGWLSPHQNSPPTSYYKTKVWLLSEREEEQQNRAMKSVLNVNRLVKRTWRQTILTSFQET